MPSTKAFQYKLRICSWCNLIKENYHPNAYLQRTRNVRNGLWARTKILDFLEKQADAAAAISKETLLSYEVTLHHLRLMETEGTVSRKGKKPYSWLLTGLGQKRLAS
jgi:hypothetical protein